MRLAARSPTGGRQERLDRRRRDRAAAPTLRVAYPSVERLRLELHFAGVRNAPVSQSHELHPPARAFFDFPCPYADCDGQLDLSGAVIAALSGGKHQAQGELECTGLRVRDCTSKQPCGLRLIYKITAHYQQDAESDHLRRRPVATSPVSLSRVKSTMK